MEPGRILDRWNVLIGYSDNFEFPLYLSAVLGMTIMLRWMPGQWGGSMMEPGKIMYSRVWLDDERCIDRLFRLRRFFRIRVGRNERWLPIAESETWHNGKSGRGVSTAPESNQ